MAKSSPHNQNRYAHGSIVSREKCYFLKVFLILWKNEMESPIFLHDKYDLYDVCFHLNIYTATFLFDWWLLCWPEIWHWIFLPIQVSQYVLWDHKLSLGHRSWNIQIHLTPTSSPCTLHHDITYHISYITYSMAWHGMTSNHITSHHRYQHTHTCKYKQYMDGLVKDCSNSTANMHLRYWTLAHSHQDDIAQECINSIVYALQLAQSYFQHAKPSNYRINNSSPAISSKLFCISTSSSCSNLICLPCEWQPLSLYWCQYATSFFSRVISASLRAICSFNAENVGQAGHHPVHHLFTKSHMGQVTKLWLSRYLVLLSIDSKTR